MMERNDHPFHQDSNLNYPLLIRMNVPFLTYIIISFIFIME